MFSLTLRCIEKFSHPLRRCHSLATRKVHSIDPLQESALNERCFLVDKNDTVIGEASKKLCHLVKPDGCVPLHRAFSVFLFNENGDLLLQKRSEEKVSSFKLFYF